MRFVGNSVMIRPVQEESTSQESRLIQIGKRYNDYPELLSEVRVSIGRDVDKHIEILRSTGNAVSLKGQGVE